ncbi:MAG TPA: peptidoglycan-binding protein [Candidatus Paceibacterota bacterium]|nr:peptidoglycan-binding protein [Candidatus Paceibacterota bacterium]
MKSWYSLTGIVLALVVVAGAMTFSISNALAITPSTAVYDSTTDPLPGNVASLGFEAVSTSAFGDYVHLEPGTGRDLKTVTVTMSDWALESQNTSFCTSYPAKCVDGGYIHPLTINIYATSSDSDLPGPLLATKTQDTFIPWRPEADEECGTGWKDEEDNSCYNGFAFNAVFDLSSLNVTLPDDVIVSIAYNTADYGAAPIHESGPYNSLNVAIPDNQPVAVGSDDSDNKVFWDATYLGRTPGLRQDTDWSPNGTVAMRIDATAPDVTVTIDKYINGVKATTVNTNSASFPMKSTWDADNIGAGTGTYTLDAGNSYEAVTSEMTSGADYKTHETSPEECTADYPYKLKGYSVGDSLGQAETADIESDEPEFENITTNKYVIVWNVTCPPAPTLLTPANDSTLTTATALSADWTDVTDWAGPITYLYESSNSASTNSDGSFTSPVYTSGPLATSEIPTTGTPEGTYYWHAKAVDNAGNSGPWANAFKVTIDNNPDTTPPAVTVTPVPGSTLSGTVTFTITVTDNKPLDLSKLTNIWSYLYNSEPPQASQGAGVAFSATGDPKVVQGTLTVDTTLLANGTAWLDVGQLEDAAGNKSGATTDNYFHDYTIQNDEAPICSEPNDVEASVSSDTTTTVDEGANSVIITSIPGVLPGAWSANIPGASWIWSDMPTEENNYSNTVGPKVFTKTFEIDGIPQDSTLDIAADNTYTVMVNGNVIDTGTSGTDTDNFSSADSWTIPAADLVTGENTLTITVTNTEAPEGYTGPNPGGLLYSLTVRSQNCTTPEPTALKVHIFKYLSADEDIQQIPNNAEDVPIFPMKANYDIAGVGSNLGEGDPYNLGDGGGVGGSDGGLKWAANTIALSPGDYYATHEVTDTESSPVVSECVPGKYKLLGYQVGDSLEDAQNAEISTTPPSFPNIQEDKYVIVVNEACDAPTPEEPETGSLTIVKHTIGGDDTFNFSITQGEHATSTSVVTDNFSGQTDPITLPAGNYNVTENVPEGWTLNESEGPRCTYDGESEGSAIENGENITIDNGDGVTCIFTNTKDVEEGSDNTAHDLALTKTLDDNTPDEGQTITYTLTAINEDESGPATNVSVTDVLPAGLTFVSYSASQGSYASGTGIWNIGTLGSIGSATLAITATVNADTASTTITNTASVSAEDNTDYNAGNNFDSVSLIVNRPAEEETTSDEPESFTLQSNGNRRNGSGGGNNNSGGLVLGASTDAPADAQVCSTPLLTTYMRMGMANSPAEVMKLQTFLNGEMNSGLPVTGFFGTMTEDAVKAFQLKYTSDILAPWGITQPTGYVFKRTQWKINMIYCSALDIPAPQV